MTSKYPHDLMLPMPLCSRAFSAFTIGLACLPAVLVGASATAGEVRPDSAGLQREVADNPGNAPAIVTRALQPAAEVTPRRAAAVTVAVLVGLGPSATVRQISDVVYTAVRTVPDRVLDVVRAAVTVSPSEAADEIAAAAVMALPDPWRQVTYYRQSAPVRRGERDFKGGPDFKGEPDYKDPADRGDGVPMTLAEAVVQTALAAGTGLSAPTMFTAVEAVLRSAPGWLITAIYDPSGISGVGDAGTNNYANEPFRRRPPTLAPSPSKTPALIKPRVPATPPPVSQ